MTPAQRRYRRLEASIGAAINAVLSLAFGLLVFGVSGRAPIPALVFDTLPQSFMVTLMSVAVPTLLTRRRRAAGAIAPIGGGGTDGAIPRSIVARSLAAAIAVALFAWAIGAWLLPLLLAAPPPIAATLAAKVAYGAALGAAMTATAVTIELSGTA